MSHSETSDEDLRRQATIASDVELGGATVPCDDPAPEAREVLCNDGKEGTAVNGVEYIPDIQGYINPIRVLVKGGTDGMSDELET